MDGSLPETERFEPPWFGQTRYGWNDAVDLPGSIEFVSAAPAEASAPDSTEGVRFGVHDGPAPTSR
jgi:hypothetical protein